MVAIALVAVTLLSLRQPAKSQQKAAEKNKAAQPAPSAALPRKASQFLPFENLSNEKENAFFADGVQDEILTDLAKIADLKVISRTSVMRLPRYGRAQPAQDRRRNLGSHISWKGAFSGRENGAR